MASTHVLYPQFAGPYIRYAYFARKRHPKSKFTPDEDAQLKDLHDRYGDDWNLIAQAMATRNPRQCRDRYVNYLSPTVNWSPWTPEEDLKLQQLHDEYGAKWVKISRHFDNRTDTNIKNRWLVLQRHHRAPKRPVAAPRVQQTSIPEVPVKLHDKPVEYDDVFNGEIETDLWDDIVCHSAYDFS